MSAAPRWINSTAADQAAALRALAGFSESPRATDDSMDAAVQSPRIVVIASGKGGVGKSNIAVNLCVNAARAGVRTVLVDADMGLANADVLCGMTVAAHLGHVIDGAATMEEVAFDAPGGFRLVSGSSGVTRMATLDRSHRARVLDEVRALGATTDLVVVDCGAGIGPTVLEFLAAAHLALIVTTPEPTAIADAYALIKAVVVRAREGRGHAGLGLIVNQARTRKDARAVHERIDQVARKFLDTRLAFAGAVRQDDAVSAAVRARWPLALRSPRSRAARDVRNLSGMVIDSLDIRCADPRAPQGLVAGVVRTSGRGARASGT
jgi:flagellar biosynthesis protein FlhG